MTICKNYYNRRPFGWTLMVSTSYLYLLCSITIGTVTCSTVISEEKLRHHHIKNSNQLLDKSSSASSSSSSSTSSLTSSSLIDTPILSCPNCLFNKHNIINNKDRERIEADKLRLEAIKRQILQKLGLRVKPNVTSSLPREVVLDTIYRAEDGHSFPGSDQEFPSTASEKMYNMDIVDVDDFYGRTSEIISFAEQGSWVNQNRLLEFQVTPERENQLGQQFRVRDAILWLKADLKRFSTSKCRTTDLYVFKIISNRLPESVTLSSKQFDRVTSEPIAITLNETHSGWQKIDLTQHVRTWLEHGSASGGGGGSAGGGNFETTQLKKDKLKLFVDCSCCSNWRIHLFNDERDRRSNPNRPFLVIHTDPNITKRVRRRAIDCSVDSGNQCCKQRFYVSFKALGWDDWVIAPQGYYANYCRGDCGHHRTPDMFVSYHTHVIEEVRKTQHLSGMTPCCAPLKFSSMSLIYYGPESTIIKRDLPKMVVDECGCP